MQKDNFALPLLHAHRRVVQPLEPARERGQLMEMGRE